MKMFALFVRAIFLVEEFNVSKDIIENQLRRVVGLTKMDISELMARI